MIINESAAAKRDTREYVKHLHLQAEDDDEQRLLAVIVKRLEDGDLYNLLPAEELIADPAVDCQVGDQ